MIQTIFLAIFIVNIVTVNCTQRIGYIYNATCIFTNINTIITYKNTCSECICQGLLSTTSLLYVGMNCYKNNKTCVLFTNYSSSSTVQININSTFIFIQQPPIQNTTRDLFPLSGVTIAGYGNGTSGSANNALRNPWGLALDVNGTFYVADHYNYRVMKFQEGSLIGSMVAGTGISGSSINQLTFPAQIAIDSASNLYINDNFNYRVMLWRKNPSSIVQVAGNGSAGSALNQIGESVGLAVDSYGNIYVADYQNHRIMKWSPNATSGVVVAGTTGVYSSSNQRLNRPYGLYIDEDNSYLYIADFGNNRIQRYSLDDTTSGTTVAGGNGQGSGSHQLYQPYDVCVSKKTGDIYIADKANHRIQLWRPGARNGTTIIGITGVTGANATLLYSPTNIKLSTNETFLYVTDTDNHRVQRYKLP